MIKKILQSSDYVTISGDKKFSRNITGYGYMALDIATSIAKTGILVDLITVSGITNGKIYKNVNFISRTWLNLFLRTRICDIREGVKIIAKTKPSFSKAIRLIFYYFSAGYFNEILKRNNYDLVHFNGIGYANFALIKLCQNNNQKFLVTLHGLYSFSENIHTSLTEKKLEKEFLKRAEIEMIPVTVISKGVKKTILNYLKIEQTNNFHVITNGFNINFSGNKSEQNIREKYNIKTNSKIMLCIGNLGVNKNQIQVVMAYSLLSRQIQARLSILFLGNDTMEGYINKRIVEKGLTDQLKLCGNVPRDEINVYYQQADFTVLASISEGFGLSIIEGFANGLPNLTYSDLDAVTDVYDEKAMITIDRRSDKDLSIGMIKMLENNWDKNYIKSHAENFSLEKMGNEYVKYYKKVMLKSE